MSARLLCRVLGDFEQHPCTITITEQLQPTDYSQRRIFCEIMLEKLDSFEIALNSLLITDKANLYFNGDVNQQNCRYYSDVNPQLIVENPLYSVKLTVWMSIAKHGMAGPYFFTQAINDECYRQILTVFLIPGLKRHRVCSKTSFHQDGANATLGWKQ